MSTISAEVVEACHGLNVGSSSANGRKTRLQLVLSTKPTKKVMKPVVSDISIIFQDTTRVIGWGKPIWVWDPRHIRLMVDAQFHHANGTCKHTGDV